MRFPAARFHLFARLVTLLLAATAEWVAAAADPRIEEFMAVNTLTVVDEDGDRPDWIEIHNPSPTSVNLSGWYLSNQATNLTQWQFPNLTLRGGGYLLVFASDKDRRTPGRPLHTNFRLNEAGEFLALVRPDGVTIAHAFDPFPPQLPDVSYGLGLNLDYETLLAEGAPARAWIPVDDSLGDTWILPGFDDIGWMSGTTGIGYDYAGYVGLDVGAMYGVNPSAYARVRFSVGNPAAYQFLTLRLRYEDGMRAWLNGTPVASDNAPAFPTWNSGATANRPDNVAVQYQDFDLTPYLGQLIAGENVLAFQMLNNGINSSDILLSPQVLASTIPIGLPIPGYFSRPTPREANGTSSAGIAGAVAISMPGGTFQTPFVVSLTAASPAPGAVIRYTLDGNPPDDASPVYSAPILISASAWLRARLFEPGKEPGPVASAAYHQLAPDVVGFSSNLPLVLVDNFARGDFPGDPYIPSAISFYEPVNGRASLTNAPHLITRAGAKRRGSSTGGQPKPNLAIEAWDELDRDRDIRPLDLPAEGDWILYAPLYFDPSLMHNPLMFELSNELGRYAVRTRFVEVFINIDGGLVGQAEYAGIYVFMEKIDREGDRVDVDRLLPEESQLPEISGGYVLKVDRADPGDSGFYAAGQSLKYVYPDEADILQPERDSQEQYLRGYFDAFGNALYGENYRDSIAGYPAYLDIAAAIDHHLLNVLAFNVDALRLSGYLYKPRNGRITFGPIWDFDRALGSTDGRDANPQVWRSELGDRGTDFFNYIWWDRFFGDLEFFQRYIDRWQDLRRTSFSTPNLHRVIDGFAAELAEAQPREQTRWGVNPRGGSYAGEIAHLKQWLADRINFMESQFVAPPTLNQSGGQIPAGFQLQINQVGPGTIYYTLDGSDPRAAGGGVADGATPYLDPVAILQTAEVRARVFDPDHTSLTGPDNPPLSCLWSGLAAARLTILPPARAGTLQVTEIQYHPPPPTASEQLADPSVDDDDFEFLELRNLSQDAIDLVGAAFVEGIDYVFTTADTAVLPAGERLLLVRSATAFALRYGSALAVDGVYSGSLSNDGERLHLVAADGTTILDFTYRDDWNRLTDGLGFSLQLRYESQAPTDPGDPAVWRVSGARLGTPGSTDPGLAVSEAVVVSEILAHTDPPLLDAVELWNRSNVPVGVGGWWLTDDLNLPRKFRIPEGTVLEAGGRLVFDEQDFNSMPLNPSNFSFSSLGDDVWLISADTSGEFTGHIHGLAFGASANGVSLGHMVNSQGSERLISQTQWSPGAPNSGPLVGPVVISEIMHEPPLLNGSNNDRDEFIELRNGGGFTVPLFDAEHDTNRWQLSGAVEYTFPPGITLSPGGHLLVVGFDPIVNPASLAAFRAAYALDGTEMVFGPWSGRLDNRGERVSLLKPDPPQPETAANPGFVPMVEVDSVNYGDGIYWSTNANGTGRSLQRLLTLGYGDEPLNWIAAAPSPAAIGPEELWDGDGDGLPTAWELLMGLDPGSNLGDDGAAGNPDGDALTNLEEWRFGTSPIVPDAPLHLLLDGTGDSYQLQFIAQPGRRYLLQTTIAPGSAWMDSSFIPAGRAPLPVEIPIPLNGAGGFFRLASPGWE